MGKKACKAEKNIDPTKAKFICGKCERVSKKEKNLCKPKKFKKTKIEE